MAFERHLTVAIMFRTDIRTGIPVRSNMAARCMYYKREERGKVGVTIKQAPGILHSHLESIIASM